MKNFFLVLFSIQVSMASPLTFLQKALTVPNEFVLKRVPRSNIAHEKLVITEKSGYKVEIHPVHFDENNGYIMLAIKSLDEKSRRVFFNQLKTKLINSGAFDERSFYFLYNNAGIIINRDLEFSNDQMLSRQLNVLAHALNEL